MFSTTFENKGKKSLIIACALALVFFFTLPAAAQSQNTGQKQQQQQQMETPDFSDERIEKTASSYTKITEIREKYQDQFSKAESTEQAQELQSKVNEKITGAIEENGMTVEQYNEVITSAQTDEDLRAELLDTIQEMRE